MPVAINDSGSPPPRSGSATPQNAGSNGNSNPSNHGGMNPMSAPSPAPGGGPPRPTTTSRRGGRSRSPVSSLGNRAPPNSSNPPAEGENPSSAAAAAAAAAKAYSSAGGGGGRGTAQPWPPEAADDYARSRGPPPPGYPGGPPPPPSMWPGEDGAYPPRGPPPTHRGGPYPPPGYGDRPPPPYGREMEYDRRYPPPRYDERGRYGPPPPRGMMGHPYPPPEYGRNYHHRGPPPPPHLRYPPEPRSSSRGGGYPPPHRGGGGNGDPSQQPAPLHPQHLQQQQQQGSHTPSRGGTSMVIGGATPIHLPKSPGVSSTPATSSSNATTSKGPPPPPSSSSSPSNKKERSIFRGRPETEEKRPPSMAAAAAAAAGGDDDDDEDSPQKILLSLRTPTTSFEENKGLLKKGTKTSPNDSFSPGDSSDPQRSPGQFFDTQRQLSKTGSIDMAPSFNLFNQSFDSFGDGHYFNVEGSLTNADSFGLGRTDSVGAEAAAQLLSKDSATNFSTQFLAPSGSGALTIGYSPVNSFGNASAAQQQQQQQQQQRSSGDIVVVGGPVARSSSPAEVFGVYSSTPSGARPLDDSHLRMSVGSFGGHSMQGYNRSPYEASPPNYYSRPPQPLPPPESVDTRMPLFYVLLRKHRHAFQGCTFLLPGVKSALKEDSTEKDDSDSPEGSAREGPPKGSAAWDPSVKSMSGPHQYQGGPMYGEPTPEDTAVARRRVESSVCAFGGSINKERSTPSSSKTSNRGGIFRGVESDEQKPTPVTPASTESTTPGSAVASAVQKARKKYEEDLPTRYYENESRLSWEFEENPPVELSPIQEEEEEDEDENPDGKNEGERTPPKSENDKDNDKDGDQYCQSVSEGDAASTETGDGKGGGSQSSANQAKMRYRCKLCGQPKQNHRCPYQQSLARSIGCMVYPAVNAFTADEPGTIAAPLSEMNNFVDIQKDETSPSRPTPDRLRHMSGALAASAQVTPESMRSGGSIGGSLRSARSGTARHGMPAASGKKRMYSKMMQGGASEQGDLLFVEAMELKPEQFRSVTQVKLKKSAAKPYVYASLPLPYAQRKRLSDNLFSLSNEVPKLTDECAQVLREARERDMWDLAVAELMTQVIVIIHCNDRDHRFEGLRQYLLTLGIAC